jgi:2-oxoisovalerate dehydrogenase E1 component
MTPPTLLERYRHMVRMRRFDEAVLTGVTAGEIHGEMHLAIGQEAIAAGMLGTLRDADAVVSTHRGHYHALAKGVPLRPLVAELFHRETGLARGRGGHMHLFDPERRFCTTGIVGASIPLALGYAYETWYRGSDGVAVAVTGDGGIPTGSFHESFNLAAVWKLPLVVICENNLYGISVRVAETSPTVTLSERARGYGAWGETVDGTDVEAVAKAFEEAVAHARAGNGPALLEAVAYRFRGHYEGDVDHYRPPAEREEWQARDPISMTRARLLDQGVDEATIDRIDAEVWTEVEEAFARAREESYPDPKEATAGVFVAAEPPAAASTAAQPPGRPPAAATRKVRNPNFSQVIAEALRIELARDPDVVMWGEDVARAGGTFGASRGLLKEFGEQRVRDTPISEMAFVGMGVGAAQAGLRPIVEVMYVDFIGVCFEQILNEMSKNHYMSGGAVRVPMTVLMAAGSIGDAAQHSQALWGLLAHIPGVKVVVPSNPYDAKGLLASAVESDDPVIYMEHKQLLMMKASEFRLGRDVPEERYTVPIGEAAVVREGRDLTLATVGHTVGVAMAAADRAAGQGVEVEVIDLRSIVPLDVDRVAASAGRTGRLLTVDEDYLSFGLSAELSLRVYERLGPAAAPVLERLAVPDVPLPAARVLEQEVLPTEPRILEAIMRVAELPRQPRTEALS